MLRSATALSFSRVPQAAPTLARQIVLPTRSTWRSVAETHGVAPTLPKQYRRSSTVPAPPLSNSTASRRRLPLFAASALAIAGATYLYLTQEDPPVLASDRWTPCRIKSVSPLTPETSLFRLEVPKSLLPPVLAKDQSARPILSLFVKEPSLQIQRAYTPLSATSFDSTGPAELDLVIKRYPDGETSRYIHRLGPGDEMELRGPSVTWYYRPQDWDEVVFVVGGTGISPAYQLLHDAFLPSSASSPFPALSIVYASPSPSRILLRAELDTLAFRDPSKKIDIRYFVDRLDEQGKAGLPDGGVVGFLDKQKLEKAIGRGGQREKRRMVVVCGPEGMINTVAGPRGRNFSQGPVGGILEELGYSEKEVIKL
ncbi:hypothetical protein JCM11641_001175 [Rhodosporidiobolus odoratus]